MPNWCWVNNRFHLILYPILKKEYKELNLLSASKSASKFEKNFICLLANHPIVLILGLMYKNSSSFKFSQCLKVFFNYILYVINLSLKKIGRGPEHGFSYSSWLSEAKKNSIFHHYFKCTEHCMNFNKQTLFLKGNLFSEGVPLLKSAVSQSRSGHVF